MSINSLLGSFYFTADHRMVLRSLVKSSDKNLDGVMDWGEFEAFGDFELAFKRWPEMWRRRLDVNDNTSAGKDCSSSMSTTSDLLR